MAGGGIRLFQCLHAVVGIIIAPNYRYKMLVKLAWHNTKYTGIYLTISGAGLILILRCYVPRFLPHP